MYNDQMNAYRGAGFLSRSAVKALMVNNSYMRRVWTIQEAVAAQDLTVWPLEGRGEVNSYQSIYVVDWPEFNAWNSHPELGPLYLKYTDEPLNDYYEGDYTGVIKNLRDKVSDAIAYLAMISKDLMWITMDRNGLVNDVKKADTASRRAWVLLNNHQIQSARSFLPEDKVLALIPLVDYDAWKAATFGVPGRQLVQASVKWAYEMMEHEMASWKWSIRIYNAPRCAARGLELLQPRRNLGDSSSMHGATPGWQLEIPPAGGAFTLPPPPAHPDDSVTACLEAAGALSAEPLQLSVEAALYMPHPGQAQYWGGGPWTHIRDVLQTDEVFRLSVQWGLEPWRNPELGIDAHRSGVVVASGGGLKHPVMIIMGLPVGEETPATGQVMEVVEVSSHLLPALLEGLHSKALGHMAAPITLVSAGVVPPPPPPPMPECEPAPTEPEWQEVPAETEPAAVAAPAAPSRSASAAKPAAPSRTASAAKPEVTAEPDAAAAPSDGDNAPRVVDPGPSEPPAAHIQKGGEASVPHSGVEVAAGAKYAGQAPVAAGDEGPCKGCVIC
ncbi:hypothetical protein GPECTOR_15g485 [Gonium pectorale]|uniref:Uncharacterized protein n=1 Tax=Gonium pectorale TaxID=33097 RepID=A0A150GLR5_GONPE|nr:hypothetical protein GPECTOR_15g485 [Gonium pectorale]|eukprot:KXZ50799.1 hypothetical protein GPECTOR_15g485 [Gonium pectorale]